MTEKFGSWCSLNPSPKGTRYWLFMARLFSLIYFIFQLEKLYRILNFSRKKYWKSKQIIFSDEYFEIFIFCILYVFFIRNCFVRTFGMGTKHIQLYPLNTTRQPITRPFDRTKFKEHKFKLLEFHKVARSKNTTNRKTKLKTIVSYIKKSFLHQHDRGHKEVLQNI